MLRILRQAIQNKPATNGFPSTLTEHPDGYRGKPVIDFENCTAPERLADLCPAASITARREADGHTVVTLDYGKCIFCGLCEEASPDLVHMTRESFLASTDRAALITQARFEPGNNGEPRFTGMIAETPTDGRSAEEIGEQLRANVRKLFGRSLHIREVDAGSCNGCEIEVTALNNPVYDIERFGVHFVASPRHADMLLVTGPVTRNMEIALKQAYEATPDPKLVVAVGACAISGGMFGKSYASCGGVNNVVPVDVYIPGCPPPPEALLHGILTAIDRYPGKA